jgi:pyrimidine-specific ribonucleoside hydrolase
LGRIKIMIKQTARICLWTAVLTLGLFFFSFAHEEHRPPVIVDTDMALDDVRALSLLLQSEGVRVLLMVTSDGAVSPEVGATNARKVLAYLKKGNIPVVPGRALGKKAPPWRGITETIPLPPLEDNKGAKGLTPHRASDAVIKVLESADKAVLYLCLGPLTNLADALTQAPRIKGRITRVTYFGGPPWGAFPGWNTLRDPNSADQVFRSGIAITCVDLPKEQWLAFDVGFYNEIKGLDSSAARLIARIHDSPEILELVSQGHLRVWDEAMVLYLLAPDLFGLREAPKYPHIISIVDYNPKAVKASYVSFLKSCRDSRLDPRQTVLLKAFPTAASEFKPDVSPYVQAIIQRHGLEEWKACFLTSELHRHLGIYSLIGAKMGIRAREILKAPFDALYVISYAGKEPPLSCLNDGLQVSTGATLGRGAIEISRERKGPSAFFVFGEEGLKLRLKPAWAQKIKQDIQKAISTCGGTGPAYFEHIRKLSLEYWLNFDRHEAFLEIREAPKDEAGGAWK